MSFAAVLRACGLALAAAATPLLAALTGRGRWTWPMRMWARWVSACLGLHVRARGPLPPEGCLLAANHLGYLDILVLSAVAPGRFVAKSEVAGWGFLGAAARRAGTVFAERESPRASRALVAVVARRLARGERVILFPEAGVAPDGSTLGSFHTMLFEAAVQAGSPVVPTALRYLAPADRRVWAWIEEPDLWRHLRTRVLPCPGVEVEVRFGDPLRPAPGTGRKDLAAQARETVRRLLESDPTIEDRESP